MPGEPTPQSGKTRADLIMLELSAYTGSITDRERARLIAAVGGSPTGRTISDLYRVAGEKKRVGK